MPLTIQNIIANNARGFYYGLSPVNYLVDDYSPQYAYSLRKLSSATTNVIRVRRSSDSTESDFSASEITDGTMLTWVGAGNGRVVKWYNQGTALTTYDLTQTTATNQPRIVISGVLQTKGGLPCVDFDGTDDYLQNASGATNTEWSFFSVSSTDTTETVGAVCGMSDSTVNSIKIWHDTRTGNKLNLNVQNSSGTSYQAEMSAQRIDTNQRLLSSVIDASKNMSAFDNGATGGTATYTGTTAIDGIIMGAQYTPKNFLNGTIQELIIFKTDKSTDRVAIQNEINGHYSIY